MASFRHFVEGFGFDYLVIEPKPTIANLQVIVVDYASLLQVVGLAEATVEARVVEQPEATVASRVVEPPEATVETSLVLPVNIARAATGDCGIACKQLATETMVVAATSFGTEAKLSRPDHYTWLLEARQGIDFLTQYYYLRCLTAHSDSVSVDRACLLYLPALCLALDCIVVFFAVQPGYFKACRSIFTFHFPFSQI